jgi:hypothetical protein
VGQLRRSVVLRGLAAAAALLLAAPLASGADPAAAHFTPYKSFRLRLGWRLDDEWSDERTEGSCTVKRHYQAGLRANVSVKVVATRVSRAGVYQWKSERGSLPTGSLAYRAVFHQVEKCKGSKERQLVLTESGGGVGGGDGRLDIDSEAGTFRAFGWAKAKEGKVREQVLPDGLDREAPGGLALQPGDGPVELKGRLPSSGHAIRSGPIEVTPALGRANARKPMVFEWTIEPWEEAEPPEVAVEPGADFERWVPSGNLRDPSQPGGRVAVRVKVHEAGNPEKRATQRARVQFALVKVSREKGVCMNWPPAGRAAENEGLRILADENPGTLTVRDAAYAETREPVLDTQVVLSSFDYGGWGTLLVTAQDESGRDLRVRIRGKETAELAVPQDENGNRIADAWERERGVSGKPGEADDETEPPGNGFPGDGLTLYEEYRGFAVQGAHVSTEPKRKDLFVADDTDGSAAGPGIDLFEQASGLKVWKLTPEELDRRERIVNRNRVAGPHLVDQHGLLVVESTRTDAQQRAVEKGAGAFGPPRLTWAVELPLAGRWGAGEGPSVVAHELGHAVGLRHHGDGKIQAVLWGWREDGAGGWALMEWTGIYNDEQTGKLIKPNAPRRVEAFFEPPEGGGAAAPLTVGKALPETLGFSWSPNHGGWKLLLGGQDGEMGGDAECLMRYADRQAFYRSAGDDGHRYVVDHQQDRPRSRFCEGSAGTETNAPGHVPCSRGGVARRGSCKRQLVVNDRAPDSPDPLR